LHDGSQFMFGNPRAHFAFERLDSQGTKPGSLAEKLDLLVTFNQP